jgi:hypothetical protein
VAFFERTSQLELLVLPAWRRGFRLGARLWGWLATLVGQLRLPLSPGVIATRVFAIDAAADGRPGARACIRTYADGSPMQIVAYASYRRGDVGYLSVAFPFPGCALNGVLRLDAIGEDSEGRLAVALSSEPREGHDDDVGIWLLLGPLRLRLPLSETMSLWAPGAPGAPSFQQEIFPGATIVGRHEQRLFGVRFATYTYGFRPAPPASSATAA